MPVILGLVGLSGAGKDTTADLILNNPHWGFHRMSFAGPLKQTLSAVFGWPAHLLDGRTAHSRRWREQTDHWWAQQLGIPEFTPRWALQHLGTDVMRQHFHSNIWVLRAQQHMQQQLQQGHNLVFTDCRFPNELEMLRNSGALLVEVRRSEQQPSWWSCAVRQNAASTAELTQLQHQGQTMQQLWPQVHQSEWSWAGLPVHQVLYNTSTVQQLQHNIQQLLQQLEITDQISHSS